MIGRASGMAARLKLLIRQHCATRQVPFNNFHSVWCFAHRLNLVTKDLMQMKGVNIVKAFADWFSDRRRQTSFKMFVSETITEEKLRRILQPSETRWTFYHDVVSAILSQHTHVEDFITVMPCFAEFWNSLRQKRQQFGLLVDRPFTFSDVELYHLFQFAEVLRALLKRVNLFLQERYLMVLLVECHEFSHDTRLQDQDNSSPAPFITVILVWNRPRQTPRLFHNSSTVASESATSFRIPLVIL